MFESNMDFEFDDEIFGNFFQPDKPEVCKRALANENPQVEVSKKLCVDNKSSSTPTRTAMFLKRISNNQEEFKPKSLLSSPQCEFKPMPAQVDSKSKVSCNSPVKKVVLRKFPGPAGLLPKRKYFNIYLNTLEEGSSKESKKDNSVDTDTICSQMSVRAFQEGPWEKMSNDFTLNGLTKVLFLPDKYNIEWIKTTAKANRLIDCKAPFLAAIIQNIEYSKAKTAVVMVLLRDATGQIRGTILPDLYEEYIDVLKVGSVVIVKQFGVLTTEHGSNQYITITANNLVGIYSRKSVATNSNASLDQSSPTSHENPLSLKNVTEVKVTVVQSFSVEDLLKNIREVKSRHKAVHLQQKLNPSMECSSVHLNLRPISEGSSLHKAGIQSSCSDNKFCLPNFRNTKGRSNNSIVVQSVPSNSRSTNSIGSSFEKTSDVNLGKENLSLLNNNDNKLQFNFNAHASNLNKQTTDNLSLLNMSDCKPRFNFKAHTGNLNKHNGILPPLPIYNKCDNSKFPQLQTVATPSKFENSASKSSDKNKNGCQFAVSPNKTTNVIQCSQISVMSNNVEDSAILQNVFEGVDADLLFEDF